MNLSSADFAQSLPNVLKTLTLSILIQLSFVSFEIFIEELESLKGLCRKHIHLSFVY